MRLDKIGEDHFIVTDDSSFVNLTLEQAQSIWSNLHLEYADLFVFIGEQVLDSQAARRSLQVMVDCVGSVAEAMQAIESGVVKHGKQLRTKSATARKPAHATAKPLSDEGPWREGGVPLLPSLPIEDIPTAPVFRWDLRPAKRAAARLQTVAAN